MKIPVVKGATSVLVRIFIQDSSSSTGAGLTGLTNASAGLVCYRARDDDGNAGGTAISLSAGTRGTWSSGGFVEKDSTNMPGWYELGIPNAALVTGSRTVGIHLKGATNMAPLPIEILLTGPDDQNANNGGLAVLPASATPGAANGILIAGTNAATIIDGLTLTGTNASGGTPGTSGLTVTGGAASTSSGGTAAPAISLTGGAGAASTNGAAAGLTVVAGGTTTVSGNDGATYTGTGNGNGVTYAHAGSGLDLNAQTTNSLQVDTRKFLGQAVLLDGNNRPKVDVDDWNGTTVGALPGNFSAFSIDASGRVDLVKILGTAVSAPATAGILDVNVKNINNVAAATPGASGGILIAGTNAATTINGFTLTGANAVGGSPATSGLSITGGAASTTSGGTSAAAISLTGGAGAASTNGAAQGMSVNAGGTTTVSGNDAATFTATGNGAGLTLAHAGSGKDLNAQTTNALQVNATAVNGVSTSSVTTVNANLGTTQPTNFTGTGASALVQTDTRDFLGQAVQLDGNNLPKVDLVDIAGSAVATGSAQLGVNVVNIAGQAAALDANNLLKVDAEDWKGTAVSAPATAGIPDINVKNYNNQTAATDANNFPKVDIESIAGNTGGAGRLDRSARAIVTGTVGSASTTTSVVTSALSPSAAVASQFKGRVLIFDKDATTANLRGQAAIINDMTSGGVIDLTGSALTTAPVSGDTFTVT